jgi:hypothetical protein
MQATLSRRVFARRVYRRNRTCKKTVMSGRIRRPADYESRGQEFESLRARHFGTELGTPKPAVFALEAATSVRNSTLLDPMMRGSFWSTSTRWASARRCSRR